MINGRPIDCPTVCEQLLVAAGEGELDEVTALVESGADIEGVSTTPEEKGVHRCPSCVYGIYSNINCRKFCCCTRTSRRM